MKSVTVSVNKFNPSLRPGTMLNNQHLQSNYSTHGFNVNQNYLQNPVFTMNTPIYPMNFQYKTIGGMPYVYMKYENNHYNEYGNYESSNICETFDSHVCYNDEVCSQRHGNLPYLWRLKVNGQWIPLEELNMDIEKAYSNPACDEATFKWTVCVLLFYYNLFQFCNFVKSKLL